MITRWSARDILARVSDLSIYPYLKKRRVPLYVHSSIHLKLFVFDTAVAFHTSGNITQRGLGTSPRANVEIGCLVELQRRDWEHIYGILQRSVRVDDAVCERAIEYLRANEQESSVAPLLRLEPMQDKEFSVLSLPASEHPEQLYSVCLDATNGVDTEQAQGDVAAACAHDLILYHVPEGLDRQAFFDTLKQHFRSHPFVLAIVRFIREHKSARFGLVNEWLQRECSDKPTPYRWELKRNTRILYTWLEYFFDEISWDRPNYSMVLRWQENQSR